MKLIIMIQFCLDLFQNFDQTKLCQCLLIFFRNKALTSDFSFSAYFVSLSTLIKFFFIFKILPILFSKKAWSLKASSWNMLCIFFRRHKLTPNHWQISSSDQLASGVICVCMVAWRAVPETALNRPHMTVTLCTGITDLECNGSNRT